MTTFEAGVHDRVMKKPESPPAPAQVTLDVAAVLRRKAEIAEERIAPMEALARLDAEERELNVVLEVARNGRFTVGSPLPKAVADAPRGKQTKGPRVTHRILVLLALERYPEGAPVGLIVRWGNQVGMMENDVVRTSVSPLLKKMSDPRRNLMEVEHDEGGRRWTITDRGRMTAEAFRHEWIEAGLEPFWEAAVGNVEAGE